MALPQDQIALAVDPNIGSGLSAPPIYDVNVAERVDGENPVLRAIVLPRTLFNVALKHLRRRYPSTVGIDIERLPAGPSGRLAGSRSELRPRGNPA
jgi:hypothetical protein